ncbi:MAG: hypothetical protein ACHQ1D_12445 [Nitrososphaerales archaeon]
MPVDSVICDSCWESLDEMDLFDVDENESTGYVICSDCLAAESQL